jgi:hypothetical protein
MTTALRFAYVAASLATRSALGVALPLVLAASICAAEPDPFTDKFAALAAKCDELGLKEQAEITRHWIIPRHPGRQYLFLPDAIDSTAPKVGSPEVARQWHARFLELRKERALALLAEARQASAQDHPTRAYQLLHEVLREDPNQADARRVLGYTKNARGQWILPGTANLQATKPRVPEPKLGWAAGSYWRLETPHFAIVTNHSAKEALELGNQLEELHALWRQVFFRYWSSGEALAARLAGRDEPLARPRPKMNVVLVKNRAEYVAHLAASVPQADKTVGIYLNQQRKSFFFAGDTSVYPTWHHEATHQLFQESVPDTVEQPGEERNFWAIEGAALYMESLAKHDGFWTLGGCEANRLQYARYRALAGDFSLPLVELSSLGREKVQTSADIAKHYAQAAGVAHFLIDGEGGQHREALVALLKAIYRGEDHLNTLLNTGLPWGKLDEQYRSFLNVTDDDLAGIPAPERLRNLSLGRTSVTDAGLSHLAGAKNLEWLDLSGAAVTDKGVAVIAHMPQLTQLFLEGTKITDASLTTIGKLKSLEELDLSRLSGITDEGLAALAPLRQLKILHLSGSPISDAGLVHLQGLKQLESLATDGTKITPEGVKRLAGTLPKLNAQP